MMIRAANLSDLQGILEVTMQTFPDNPQSAEGYAEAIEEEVVLVGEAEGGIIGFGLLRGANIEQLYILKDSQGKGIGSKILAKLETIAGENGFELIHAYAKAPESAEQGRLERFYEMRGYERQPKESSTSGTDFIKHLGARKRKTRQ
jgi:GNAT superfamily N-acetyltransferase